MAATLHIVDPGFFQPIGHHRSMNDLLARAGRAAGRQVRLLAHKTCPADAAPEAELLAVLDHAAAYSRFPAGVQSLVAPQKVVLAQRNNLREWLEPALAAGDVVLAHTARYMEIIALLAWANETAATEVTLRIVFRGAPSRYRKPEANAFVEAWLRYAFAELAPAAGVTLDFVADTEALASDMTALTGRPVGRLPPPVDFRLVPEPDAPPPETPIIGHVGGLRGEKGREPVAVGGVELLARHPTAKLLLHLPADGAANNLPAKFADRIEVVAEALDPAQFYALIQRLSAVLVPYDPDEYRLRTSHILVEALALARPVVTTEGTWMAEVVRSFDPQPGTIMADYSPESLAAAGSALLDDLPAKQAAAARAAPQIRARHDAATVGARLIQPAEGAAS